MKVVILGSGGMLGSALMRSFSKFDPIGLDKDQLDITNRDAIYSVFGNIQPELIINAAGYTAVDDAEKNKALARSVNGDAVGFLAEYSANHGVPLVHYSTDYIFDGRQKNGCPETAQPNPLNVYGESKWRGEQFLYNSGAPFYLIRTSWLFGPNGKNFVRTMLDLAQSGKDISVVNDQFGKPTYTIDLAEVTFSLLQEKRPHGIYHLVNEDAVSWYDFAKEIFEIKGVNVDVKPISSKEFCRPARRPKNAVLINTRFPFLRSHKLALRDYLKNL